MDWGTLIPLAFVPETPVVVVSPARDRPLAEHVELGRAIASAAAASGKRVALVASADHGHAHDPDGPYGFDPAAAEYDEAVVELVRANRLDRLRELEPLVDAAKADSLWQLVVLHGALGDAYDGRAALVRGADLLRDALRRLCAVRALMPPGLVSLGVAAAGALALAVGLVALLNGRVVGAALVLGGVALLAWSVLRLRA